MAARRGYESQGGAARTTRELRTAHLPTPAQAGSFEGNLNGWGSRVRESGIRGTRGLAETGSPRPGPPDDRGFVRCFMSRMSCYRRTNGGPSVRLQADV